MVKKNFDLSVHKNAGSLLLYGIFVNVENAL